mgnify:CR=1 FL=1
MAVEGYDIVGDVHGHADKLEGLLRKMGYSPRRRGYRPPLGRQLVFLGDLIDGGPEQVRVLEIARSMMDEDDARAVMGNHEFNAICYATPDPATGGLECLRPHRGKSEKAMKNRDQHREFLKQVGEDSAQHREWVEWFKRLPPCLDLGGIRVVHGCWDQDAVNVLHGNGWDGSRPLSGELLLAAHDKKTRIGWARNLLTCGLEVSLPEGSFIIDRAGHRHSEVRVASWRDWAERFADIALVPKGQEELLIDMPWPAEIVISAIEGSPVFVGHHWFTGDPKVESPKFACLDWSAAKGGPLVGYRWDGETHLGNEKLVWFHSG